jgi:RNA polymerase sigma-70 factor (ECF subfamily)
MALSSDERGLIARAITRDPEAFSELYIRFHDPVLRRVITVVKDRGDAEDITAETFLRAWNAIGRFQDRDVSILAWFCTIGERLAIKHVKHFRPNVAVDDVVITAPVDSNPENVVEQAVGLAALKSALSELPAAQRDILTHRYLDEMGYSELGMVTGKAAGTVRVMHHRALKALRAILSKPDRREELNAFTHSRPVRPARVTK